MILDNQEGRPLVPVTPTTAQYPITGPAIPVVGYTSAPAGVTFEGGPALPVYLVSAGELAQYGLQAGPAVPMVLASSVGVTTTTGQRPIPVYVVSGSLNPTPPAPPEIALAWSLDSGPPFAPFVGAGNLTATGAVTTATGIIGCGAGFDGASYLSTLDQASARLAVGIAVECWLRPASLVGAFGVLAKYDFGGISDEYGLFQNDDTVGWRVWNGGGAPTLISSPPALTIGAWAHVVGVVAADLSLALYINGASVATSAPLASLASPAVRLPVAVGALAGGIAPMPAGVRIDEPRIWQFGVAGDPGAAFWLARYNGGAGQSDRGAVAPCP